MDTDGVKSNAYYFTYSVVNYIRIHISLFERNQIRILRISQNQLYTIEIFSFVENPENIPLFNIYKRFGCYRKAYKYLNELVTVA